MKRFMAVMLFCAFLSSEGAALPTEEEENPLEAEVLSLRRDLDALRAYIAKDDEQKEENGFIKHPGFEALKISGEIRIREELNNHLYSPTNPQGRESFDILHMRTRLRFDLDVVEDLTAVVEFQDVRILGEPTTNDAEGMDLKRGEFIWSNILVDGLSLEAGRFVMAYGDQRIIGHLEWADQGRTYDGVRVSYKPGEWYADFFGFRTNDLWGSDADDQDMIGVYAGMEEVIPCLGVEGYVLLYRDQVRAVPPPVVPLNMTEKRFVTVGVRTFGDEQGFDYTGEVAYQKGDVGVDDLEAFAFAVKGGYTVDECDWTPRFGVEVDYASGDHRPGDGDNQQFQHLFPTNHAQYGYADLVGWSNMWDFRSSVSVKPRDNVDLSLDWHHLLLADSDGGWINAGGAVVRPGAANVSRHLGEEVDLQVKWSPLKALNFLAGWAHLFPGGFLDDTGRSRAVDFVYLQSQVRF